MTGCFHTTGRWSHSTHSNAPLLSGLINCIPNISVHACTMPYSISKAILISIYLIVDLFRITVMAMNSINLYIKLTDEENLMV